MLKMHLLRFKKLKACFCGIIHYHYQQTIRNFGYFYQKYEQIWFNIYWLDFVEFFDIIFVIILMIQKIPLFFSKKNYRHKFLKKILRTRR